MTRNFAIGQNFSGLYPASNGEGLTLREGVVEAVGSTWVKVKLLSGGYRTLSFDKLIVPGVKLDVHANTTGMGGSWSAISGMVAEVTDNDIVLVSGENQETVLPIASIGQHIEILN